MKSDESFISSLIKNISYAVLVGVIYYFGTYFWISIFVRDEELRERYATWGLLSLQAELILIILFIFYGSNWVAIILHISAIHAGINLLGAILNAFRFIISLFLKADENLYKSTIILFALIIGLAVHKYA